MKVQLTTNPESKPAEEPEEAEAEVHRIHDTIMDEEAQEEDWEFEEPQRPVDPPLEKNPHKRKPAWVRELIQGAERYGAPEENHRERKRTRSNSGYVALLCDFIDKEPSSYVEAAEQKEWKDAMIEEYQSIIKNDDWVVPWPEGKLVVTSKRIYKIKHVVDGSIETYKERFVAWGFSQKEGIDYEETFAPVARYTSTRSVPALAAVMKWKIHQMDVKTTFLNGVVEEEV